MVQWINLFEQVLRIDFSSQMSFFLLLKIAFLLIEKSPVVD